MPEVRGSGQNGEMGARVATDKAALFRANGPSSEPCGASGGLDCGLVGHLLAFNIIIQAEFAEGGFGFVELLLGDAAFG